MYVLLLLLLLLLLYNHEYMISDTKGIGVDGDVVDGQTPSTGAARFYLRLGLCLSLDEIGDGLTGVQVTLDIVHPFLM